MKREYRTVDTSTLKGLKQAERLHTSGWKTIHVGLFLIQFEREVKSKGIPCANMRDLDKIMRGF